MSDLNKEKNTILKELIDYFDTLWPTDIAEPWDENGLIVGNKTQVINKVLLCVDVTLDLILEAKNKNIDLILAHHPFLLYGIKTVAEDTSKGKVLSEAIKNNIAIFNAHTNADKAINGVSFCLAQKIGLEDINPLMPLIGKSGGLGSVGYLNRYISLNEFANDIAQKIPSSISGIKIAGDLDKMINKVALCAGAGDSLLRNDEIADSDVYITSDLRHHPALEHIEQVKASGGPALIDIPHWAAEHIWLEEAKKQIQEKYKQINVEICSTITEPWSKHIDTL